MFLILILILKKTIGTISSILGMVIIITTITETIITKINIFKMQRQDSTDSELISCLKN